MRLVVVGIALVVAGVALGQGATAKWNQVALQGEVSNRLVTVTINGPDVTVALADGRVLLEDLHYYGWLSDTPDTPRDPDDAARRLARLATRDYSSAVGSVVHELGWQPERAILEIEKHAAAKAQGMIIRERYTLAPGQRGFEYRVTMRNETGRTVYIVDCDGIIYGRWAAGMSAPKMRRMAGPGEVPLSKEWLTLSPPQLRESERMWAAVTTEPGPSVGVVLLAGGVQTWAFTDDAMYLYEADAEGRRPIKLGPGMEVTWGVEIMADEKGGEAAAEDVHDDFLAARRAAGVKVASVEAGAKAELLWPADGQSLTDVAAFFTWRSVPGAERYDVELERKDAEATAKRVWELGATTSAWMAEKPLAPGTWTWRVRPVGEDGIAGDWSGERAFTVNAEHPVKAPVRGPSAEKPLFILHAPSEVDRAWSIVPKELRPYCALRVEVAERDLDFADFCKRAEAGGVPVIVQCSGPGGGVYTEVYDKRYGRQSLAALEWAFQHCPHVIGALVCEQSFHLFSDPTSAEYIRRLEALAAKYGRLIIWADGHWAKYTWLQVGADEKYLRLLSAYPKNVVPLWKMNCAEVPLTIGGALMGLWMTRVVDQWGVEPEAWYWYEARYKGLGEQLPEGQTGDWTMCPATFWGQMILTGVAGGASCFCLEPYSSMWEKGDPEKPTEAWTTAIAPLMKAIVEKGLVPTKAEVDAKVKVAVQTRPEDLKFSRDFGVFRAMYETLYGIRHRAEVIPDSGRYYLVPLLGPLLAGRELPRGVERVGMPRLATAEGVHAVFDAKYPDERTGEAFAVRIGGTLLAMNNRENEDQEEDWRLPIGKGGVVAIGGRLGPHAYVVGRVGGERLWLHVNGRKERTSEVWVEAEGNGKAEVKATGAAVVRWDEARKRAVVEVEHKAGAVEIEVKAKSKG